MDAFGTIDEAGNSAKISKLEIPEMEGYEANRRIRASHDATTLSAVPIIALTANGMREDIQQCLEARMDAHLAKPLRLQELQRCLTEWLPH